MQIIVRGTKVPVTEDLREHAEKKLERLGRLLHDSAKVEVIQHSERELQITEIILQGDGFTLRAKERTADMYASMDAAADKIERQLKRLKEKKRSHIHVGTEEAKRREATGLPFEGQEPGAREALPRRKLFSKPMTEDEAVLQIDAIGEEIFIFHNVATQQANVLHRLADGSLELIEPETS